MAVKIETFEMPVGVEAAVWGLDSIVRRDKTCPVQAFVSGDGNPSVTFYNADGTITSAVFVDGAWHEVGTVV